MKFQLQVVAAFIVAACFTNTLQAQEATAKTAGYDLKKSVKCRVSSTSTGCDIVFNHEVKSPRDAASGLATGKRVHKPYAFSISSSDNTVSESSVVSASSAKSAGGKVSVSDLNVMITIKGKTQKLDVTDGEFSLPADCPDGDASIVASWSWGATNSSSSSKSCSVGFIATMQDGTLMAINEKGLPGTKTTKGTTKN